MSIPSANRTFTHSFNQISLTHSVTHSLILSVNHPFTQLFINSPQIIFAWYHKLNLHYPSLSRRWVSRMCAGGSVIWGACLEGAAAGGWRQTAPGEPHPGTQPAAAQGWRGLELLHRATDERLPRVRWQGECVKTQHSGLTQEISLNTTQFISLTFMSFCSNDAELLVQRILTWWCMLIFPCSAIIIFFSKRYQHIRAKTTKYNLNGTNSVSNCWSLRKRE